MLGCNIVCLWSMLQCMWHFLLLVRGLEWKAFPCSIGGAFRKQALRIFVLAYAWNNFKLQASLLRVPLKVIQEQKAWCNSSQYCWRSFGDGKHELQVQIRSCFNKYDISKMSYTPCFVLPSECGVFGTPFAFCVDWCFFQCWCIQKELKTCFFSTMALQGKFPPQKK